MTPEVISKLVGMLNFQVDTSGLRRFQQAMKQAERQMQAMSKQADALQKKLGLKVGLKPTDNTAAQAKIDKAIRASLDRQSKMEVVAARAKRATFMTELAGQKLVFAQQKASAFQITAALKDRQQMAVLAAKEARAEGEKLKVQGQVLKNENTLAQAKARQARIDAISAQQAQRTLNLQAQRQRSLSATQRIEQAMQQARERGQRQGQRFLELQAAAKARAARQDERHQQQQQRFQWAQTRQAQWEANRNKPEPSTGFLGLGTGALAVGGIAAGLAGVVAAVNAVGERISATQTRVADSQQYRNTLVQAGGANPANQKFAMEEFFRISDKYGTSADINAAKNYRTFLLAELARGKSISQATRTFEIRQSAFSGAAMSREEQTRANLQLQQIASKGQGDREDLNTFSESAPLLVEPIRRAWAERNNHPLDKSLEKDFRNSTTQGNLKAEDFTRGIEIFVRENAAAIERQSQSIQANSTRLENAQYVQQAGLDQNPALIDSINERIKSEIELNEAMKPLRETAIKVDTALNKLAASFLRWTLGKDATVEDAAKKVDGLSPDKPAIDPASFNGQPLDGEVSPIQDPVDKLWNKLFGKSDVQHDPETPKVDVSDMTDKWLPIIRNMPAPLTANDMQRMNETQKANQTLPGRDGDKTASEPATVNTDNSVTNNITMPPIELKVTINAPAGASPDLDLYAMPFRRAVRAEVQNMFQKYMPAEVE
jgi:hypothetical protein